MKTGYFFDIDANSKKYICQAIDELKEAGVPISNSVKFEVKQNAFDWKYLGICTKNPPESDYAYTVTLNDSIKYRQDFVDVVAHELLHTVPTTANERPHGKTFKKWMLYVNSHTNLFVTTNGKLELQKATYDKNTPKVYSEFCSPLSQMTDEQKEEYITNVLSKLNPKTEAHKIMPHVYFMSAQQCESLVLQILKNNQNLLFDREFLWSNVFEVLKYRCAKSVFLKIANFFLKDELPCFQNMTYADYAAFSGIFDLTKIYSKISEKYNNETKPNC